MSSLDKSEDEGALEGAWLNVDASTIQKDISGGEKDVESVVWPAHRGVRVL